MLSFANRFLGLSAYLAQLLSRVHWTNEDMKNKAYLTAQEVVLYLLKGYIKPTLWYGQQGLPKSVSLRAHLGAEVDGPVEDCSPEH